MIAFHRHRKYGRYLRAFFNLSDMVLFNALYALTLWIEPPVGPYDQKLMWVLVNVCYLAVLVRNRGVNHKDRTILLDRVVADSLLDVGIHALFFLSTVEILSQRSVPLVFYVVYYAMAVVAIPLWNVITRRFVKGYRRRGFNYTSIVIVGTNPTSERLLEQLESDSGYGYKALGFFDTECLDDFRYKDKFLGDIDALAEYSRQSKVDQIFFTRPDTDDSVMKDVVRIADSAGIEFLFVPQIRPTLSRGFMLHNIGAMPVLAGRRNPLKNPFNSFVKRAFDVVGSSIFLVTLYPLIYLPIAAVIKLTSPGPVYFRQKRTGYKGQSFDCLKFRTMHVNGGADTRQATADDPRKTKFGTFLRRTSLDELPQFINVWRGEMSIVGPRPHMLKHTEDYSKLIDRYMARHVVKPGITGWAQVNGYRGVTDQLWKMERRVEFDVWYIEHWTFLLDMKIIVRTVLNVFAGEKNAY